MTHYDPFWNRSLQGTSAAVVAIALAMTACRTSLASSGGAAPHEESEEELAIDEASASKVRGIELGEFRIRAYYPVQAQKSMVRFVLHANVPGDSYSETKQLAENRRHKIRDQIITATRMVPLAELDQADLASFRRRILLRLRRTLPELEISDVYVSNFELKVQNL